MEQQTWNILARKKRTHLLIGLMLAAVIFAAALFLLGVGAMQLDAQKIMGILWAKITQNSAMLDGFRSNEVAIVWDIRLPRILCALFVGMGLAVGGTIFQSLLCNPLADPYTLGVSTGAAFGASLAIYLGMAYGLLIPITPAAFVLALLTLAIVIVIAQKGGGMLSSSLIISGIIVSSIFSSGISFLKMLAGEHVSAIIFWLMGSLSASSWKDVFTVAPVVLAAGALAYYFADDLNIMTMGDDAAQALGVPTKRIRLLYLILGSCITAACVAVSGIIGFVGLVVPHILRFWLTSDNRTLMPLSALTGGLLLLLADSATRIFAAGEIPVGVLTTLLGGPFFIVVFLRHSNRRG